MGQILQGYSQGNQRQGYRGGYSPYGAPRNYGVKTPGGSIIGNMYGYNTPGTSKPGGLITQGPYAGYNNIQGLGVGGSDPRVGNRQPETQDYSHLLRGVP